MLQQGMRQRQQFTKALHAGESAADEGDREELSAFRAGRQCRGPVEGREQTVPDNNGLLHVLQPEGLGRRNPFPFSPGGPLRPCRRRGNLRVVRAGRLEAVGGACLSGVGTDAAAT